MCQTLWGRRLNRAQGRHGALHCHVARSNPVCQDVLTGDEVLVVFRAADAYISPQCIRASRRNVDDQGDQRIGEAMLSAAA
ncbi:FMN-binding negative transcriptional regulator [Mesorhizobium sp.]|uniref:FMN-binding negative transcriptional regulator n=1 Tax=Mesorhizobium sp. TaxID=1871066 RepID=UPI00120E59E1|nr:FMN-binding negative transcriptional regulator [Mesorhizobium sp.]TIS35867.1 MAG: FMN-binding negative transcriptional regulator [Mesorhizobium sp.]TIX75963.1 MAG: FMN-binding negative transcriptional regulator [Mesorhizobium sp.]